MPRSLLPLLILPLLVACSSSGDSSGTGGSGSGGAAGSGAGGSAGAGGGSAGAGGGASGACPDVSGAWKITAHCDPSLIGKPLTVTQNACALSFAPPFDGFAGTVGADGKLTLTGPQSCTGTASTSTISMTCTPGTCLVTVVR